MTMTWKSYPTTFNTYSVPSRWWEPNGWKGYVYTSRNIEGLVPGQTYKYRITSTHLSRDGLFFTVPKGREDIERAKEPTSIAVWGDMGVVPLYSKSLTRY